MQRKGPFGPSFVPVYRQLMLVVCANVDYVEYYIKVFASLLLPT